MERKKVSEKLPYIDRVNAVPAISPFNKQTRQLRNLCKVQGVQKSQINTGRKEKKTDPGRTQFPVSLTTATVTKKQESSPR